MQPDVLITADGTCIHWLIECGRLTAFSNIRDASQAEGSGGSEAPERSEAPAPAECVVPFSCCAARLDTEWSAMVQQGWDADFVCGAFRNAPILRHHASWACDKGPPASKTTVGRGAPGDIVEARVDDASNTDALAALEHWLGLSSVDPNRVAVLIDVAGDVAMAKDVVSYFRQMDGFGDEDKDDQVGGSGEEKPTELMQGGTGGTRVFYCSAAETGCYWICATPKMAGKVWKQAHWSQRSM